MVSYGLSSPADSGLAGIVMVLCCLYLLAFDGATLLTKNHTQFFNRHGYLHIPNVFTPDETLELATELDWLIVSWAGRSSGWSGDCSLTAMDTCISQTSSLPTRRVSWRQNSTGSLAPGPVVPQVGQAIGDRFTWTLTPKKNRSW